MSNMHSFVQTIPLPRKYMKAGISTIEVVEFGIRSRRMPNGYWVTLAAIWLPSKHCVVYGASACSPFDDFDRNHAHNMALGRARQVTYAMWAGDSRSVMNHPTMLGYANDCVWCPESVETVTFEAVSVKAEPLFDRVALHAAREHAEVLKKYRNSQDPDFEWFFILRPDRWEHQHPPKKVKPQKEITQVSVNNHGVPAITQTTTEPTTKEESKEIDGN